MANFCHYVATYADGRIEEGDLRLWFLGGIKDEDGHAKLASLKEKKDAGIITRLILDYES